MDGPVGFLSGVSQQPQMLFLHFFAVAFYAIFLSFREASLFAWPGLCLRSVSVLGKACSVLFPVVLSEVQA